MTDYQNAISDKLIVICRPDACSLIVASKTGQLKHYNPKVANNLSHELKVILSSSIFALSTVVYADMPFVLCPSGISDEEKALHLELNLELNAEWDSEPFGQGLDLLYLKNPLLDELKPLLVEPVFTTDIKVLDLYKGGLGHKNAAYLNVYEGNFTLRLYSGTKLILAQRFRADQQVDILYHLANSLEQLKIDVTNLQLEYIGSSQNALPIKEMSDQLFPELLILDPLDQQGFGSIDDSLVAVCVECV